MSQRRDLHVLFFPHPAIWAATGALLVLVSVWAQRTGFSVRLLSEGNAPVLRFLGGLFVFLLFAAWALRETRPNVSRTISAVLLFLIFGKISLTMNYLGVRAAFPLSDALLHRMDAAIGFDWSAHVGWVNSHPGFMTALVLSYKQILPLIAFAFVIIAALQDFRRLREYMTLLFVTMLVVDVFAIFMPAMGAYGYLKPPAEVIGNMPAMAGRYSLHDFIALRAGEMNSATFEKMTGLVTFPSFHTIAALLTTWALRGKILFWAFAAVNALALVSTISIGGHYLTDVIAGAVVFALAVAGYRALEARAEKAPAGDASAGERAKAPVLAAGA